MGSYRYERIPQARLILEEAESSALHELLSKFHRNGEFNVDSALRYLDQIHKERQLELSIFASRKQLFITLWSAALAASIAALNSSVALVVLLGPLSLGLLARWLAVWSCESLGITLEAVNYRHMWWINITDQLAALGLPLGFAFRKGPHGDTTHDEGFEIPWRLRRATFWIWSLMTAVSVLRFIAMNNLVPCLLSLLQSFTKP